MFLVFKYPGVNIIGQLPGRYTGSRDDEIVLIGAHYDSEDTTPGVNDNGSGMTALLQALELYTNPGLLLYAMCSTSKYGKMRKIYQYIISQSIRKETLNRIATCPCRFFRVFSSRSGYKN